MVATTLLGTTTFNTTSGTKTVVATPAVNDLIVIVAGHSGNTSVSPPTDDQGGTYTLIASAVKNTGADILGVFVRDALIPSASSTTFSHAPGSSSGGGLAVIKITGMTRFGLSAIRQSAVQNNQAGGTVATPVFSTAVLTTNAVIGALLNATTPASVSPRSSPSYSELLDVGYSTPTTGLQVMRINSGETGTSIAWNGTSPSAFASLVVELDTSAVTSSTASGTGTSSAAATGTSTVLATATTSGTSTADAVNPAGVVALASAEGTSTVSAISVDGTPASAGSALGSATSTAVGSSMVAGAASAAGGATVSAVGSRTAVGSAGAAGAAVVTALGRTAAAGSASSVGSAGAGASGSWAARATSTGTSTATAEVLTLIAVRRPAGQIATVVAWPRVAKPKHESRCATVIAWSRVTRVRN